MSLTDIVNQVRKRVEMLDIKIGCNDVLAYSVRKSAQQAAVYCNISGMEYFPPDAEIYLTEYAASDYLLDNTGFSPRWEKMRKDAEIGLLRFRRVRW